MAQMPCNIVKMGAWARCVPKTSLNMVRSTSSAAPETSITVMAPEAQTAPSHEETMSSMDFDILAVTHKSNVRLKARVTRLSQVEEPEEKDKHYAPQHRKYLTHPKVGDGTPAQRARMDNTYKFDQAIANATTYRMNMLGYTNSADANMLTRSSDIDGLVEDKIQLSIMQGEFDNLKGAGKPLQQEWNPFIDSTTAMAFKVMHKNGLKPEWVEKQSTISQLSQNIRSRIRGIAAQIWLDKLDDKCDSLTDNEISVAELMVVASSNLRNDVGLLNRQIDVYNLQVPALHLTRMRFLLPDEAARAANDISIFNKEQALQLIRAAQEAERSSQRLCASLRGCIATNQVNPYTTPVAQFLFRKGASEDSSWDGRLNVDTRGTTTMSSQSSDVLMKTLMSPVDRLANFLLRKIVSQL